MSWITVNIQAGLSKQVNSKIIYIDIFYMNISSVITGWCEYHTNVCKMDTKTYKYSSDRNASSNFSILKNSKTGVLFPEQKI